MNTLKIKTKSGKQIEVAQGEYGFVRKQASQWVNKGYETTLETHNTSKHKYKVVPRQRKNRLHDDDVALRQIW